jgi:hypothetical protein
LKKDFLAPMGLTPIAAYTSEEDIAAASSRQIMILHKPFSPQILLETVHQVLHAKMTPLTPQATVQQAALSHTSIARLRTGSHR